MKLLGKHHAVPIETAWRMDCDYLDKLAPAEREYAERFLREYYLGEGLYEAPEVRLHKNPRQVKELGVARVLVAAGDLITAPSQKVALALVPAADGNLRKRGSYSDRDYKPEPDSPEDAVIALLDAI